MSTFDVTREPNSLDISNDHDARGDGSQASGAPPTLVPRVIISFAAAAAITAAGATDRVACVQTLQLLLDEERAARVADRERAIAEETRLSAEIERLRGDLERVRAAPPPKPAATPKAGSHAKARATPQKLASEARKPATPQKPARTPPVRPTL